MSDNHPRRSGRIIFAGKGDAALLKLRAQIKREEMARVRIVGRVPSQDIDATAPGYVHGLSKQVMK